MQAKVDIDERQVYDYLTNTHEGRSLLEDLCLDILNGHVLDTNMYRLQEWRDDNVFDESEIREEAFDAGYETGYESGYDAGCEAGIESEGANDCE